MTVTAASWELTLPYAAPPLRANDRRHWGGQARIVAQIRRDTHHMAKFLHLPRGLERITVCLNWQPNTTRRRDRDGIYPTLKAALDGLVDYGMVADDDASHVWPSCEIHPLAASPRVWLTIGDVS